MTPPSRSILVGLRGDRSADETALALAKTLAEARQARIAVATIVPPTIDHLADVQHIARRATTNQQELTVERVAAPSTVEGLKHVADRVAPELIVLGPSHRPAVALALHADTADELLFDGPWGIAVARDACPSTTPRRVSVGWDGTPEADAAVQWAAEVAARLGATLDVIRAIPPDHRRVHAIRAQFSLRALCIELADICDVRARLVWGDVVSSLADLAGEDDLLVVGARTEAGGHRPLYGSVSRELLQRASCPVVVLPEPEVIHRAAGLSRA